MASAPNFFTQAGLNQPVSFTLRFAAPLGSVSFKRAGLVAATGAVSHPHWTATILDADGTALASGTEGLIIGPSSIPEKSFTLAGDGIAALRFDSDSEGVAAFSAVLLDDLFLNTNAAAAALAVSLAVVSPPTNSIVAPATIQLSASVVDNVGTVSMWRFLRGANVIGTVSGAPYRLTWTNVLAGNYPLYARVTDVSGQTAHSKILPITVQLPADATVINFDALNTTRAAATGVAVRNYLASFGAKIASLSAGTALTVDREGRIAGGAAVNASSAPNLLTQPGSSGLCNLR